jgi:hypothetical protein
MNKDNKNTELDNKDEKLHISDVSCSIDDIKKWVDSEIGYYDPDDCEWNYTVGQAIEDMLANFKTHFLNIDYTKKFDKENELIKYFKSEWEQYYNKDEKLHMSDVRQRLINHIETRINYLSSGEEMKSLGEISTDGGIVKELESLKKIIIDDNF